MKILKQTRKRIMLRAWYFKNYKYYPSFSMCLKNSWKLEKQLQYEALEQMRNVVQNDNFLTSDEQLFNQFAKVFSSDIVFTPDKPVVIIAMMNSYVVQMKGNKMLAYTNNKCVGDISNALWAVDYIQNGYQIPYEMKRKLYNFASCNNQIVSINDRTGKTFAA